MEKSGANALFKARFHTCYGAFHGQLKRATKQTRQSSEPTEGASTRNFIYFAAKCPISRADNAALSTEATCPMASGLAVVAIGPSRGTRAITGLHICYYVDSGPRHFGIALFGSAGIHFELRRRSTSVTRNGVPPRLGSGSEGKPDRRIGCGTATVEQERGLQPQSV